MKRHKKASLQEVAKYLDKPYSTVVKWDKKKKEALRYGLPVIRDIQASKSSGLS